jgi:hypothetical protein
MSNSQDKPQPIPQDERVIEWLDDIGIGFERKKPVQSDRSVPASNLPKKNQRDAA